MPTPLRLLFVDTELPKDDSPDGKPELTPAVGQEQSW